MKKNITRMSYLLIVLNLLITVTSIILLISLVEKIHRNTKFWSNTFNISLFLTVLIFMFVFMIGTICLFVYKYASIDKLLMIGVLNVIPLPLLSIANIILLVLFLMNINENLKTVDKKGKVEIKGAV